MDQDPRTILQSLRALVPARPLQHHEAQGIAERQATRLLALLDQRDTPVEVGLIAELPRIEVRVVPNRDIAGLSGMSQWLKKESRWLIAVNRDDSQTRRRFTLGHEFKHIVDNPYINVLYPKDEDAKQSAEERAERHGKADPGHQRPLTAVLGRAGGGRRRPPPDRRRGAAVQGSIVRRPARSTRRPFRAGPDWPQ